MTKKKDHGGHIFSNTSHGGNSNLFGTEDLGYKLGEVVTHMHCQDTAWTVTAFVKPTSRGRMLPHCSPQAQLTNNETGQTKLVGINALDAYWSKHEPKPVRIWTPDSGWTK